MKRLKALLLVCASVLSGVSAQAVMAQTAIQPHDAGRDSAHPDAADIVVTARQRAEQVQRIPDAITAISEATLAQTNVTGLSDVASQIPNVSFVESLSPGSEFFNIRGVIANRNGDPSVAVIVDGVQSNSGLEFSQGLFDLKQIEVLKGPQGALYGRDAIGGAMIITTKDPTDKPQYKFMIGAGNAGLIEAQAVASGPIVMDKLFYRVAASFSDFDGTNRDVFLNRNTDFANQREIKAGLLWKPGGSFSADLRYTYSLLKAGANYWVAHYNDFEQNDNDAQSQSNTLAVDHRTLNVVSLKLANDFGFATLQSVSGYSGIRDNLGQPGTGIGTQNAADLAWGPYPIWSFYSTNRSDIFSQEIRLTSRSGQPFRWVVGAFGLKTNAQDHFPVFIAPGNFNLFQQNLAQFRNGTRTLAHLYDGLSSTEDPGAVQIAFNQNTQHNDAEAIFGNANYDLTKVIELTAGLRYDVEHRHQTDDRPAAIIGNDPKHRNVTFDSLQPKFSIAWKPTAEHLLYATVSKGFRSGGFNPASTSYGRTYQAEQLWNYEAGFKGSFLDRKLRFSAAAFYEDYHNVQEYEFDGSLGAQTLYTIPRAWIKGIEADSDLRLSSALHLGVAGGLMDSKITQFDAVAAGFPSSIAAGAQTALGKHLPNFAHWSVNAYAQYRWTLGSGDITARIDYALSGKQYWWIDNLNEEKNISLVNATVTYKINPAMSLQLWSKNLLNERYNSSFEPRNMTSLFSDIAYPAPQRTFGARMTATF
ncbi:TonB-dependent receptor [Novosphingobium terrae]|uniref:TonB-dependent receptor n=1 Tax=Novosphingobium terrae TaxID=2726189 RepID=UPI0019824617|nr:TonB-dependent receptor [Novosphingobium terrae]